MHVFKNKVQLTGNLGGDPDVRTFEKGRKLARFSLATNESYRSANGERIAETQWHTLIAWGRMAEMAEQFLFKGTEIVVEGKLVNRNYSDKEGNKRYVTEVHVNEILILGGDSKHISSD